MSIQLDAIRDCFEGVIPGTLATVSRDGTPNVSYLSHVQYIDHEHVALTWQFFNKTRQNLLANRKGMLAVIDPATGAHYRLQLDYQRTETAGPLFESMKARLAGIASHVGMTEVFKLLGADVFKVKSIAQVPGETMPDQRERRNLLAAVRAASEKIRHRYDLGQLLQDCLHALQSELDVQHAMVLLYDGIEGRLYTVASLGYDASGIGSEIRFGEGIIGVAARERAPIRISHMAAEYGYSRAIRTSSGAGGSEIPFPGLAESRSQLAVPLLAGPHLVGVLYVESPQDMRFSYDDEDALVTLGGQLAMTIDVLRALDDDPIEPDALVETPEPEAEGEPVVIKHFPENDSIFLDGDYLIKGVAGSIFAMLVADFMVGRTEFTNRELRLDPRVRLPDISDNLEGRLLLLSRRLDERQAPVRIEKTGRGRFRVVATRPLRMADA
jgi:adenylate cyclase